MVTEEKIRRINELSAKSKRIGLTEEEKAEQAALRNEYIQAVRGSLKANLDSIRLVDESGKEVGPLSKKKKYKH
ncbi:DUF896 domain-containing protein [Aneurinibacillus migulanus]|uniref:UPF0291 protein AF333_18605 n=1 Tax=Aneurinibacillus migulanus TaxID=47500 RepID=A0A0D1Y090_ANEMI|nr:DUF896 domain-containing protein [Aneurinibacillus migulanus]KIV57733.1 hypothetical protein TS65_08740 [Aneurinibacillus migulanus]KON97172.1 hypothetical protein AF333_18605 [Aneurinibacillus migulanus]MED0896385.1 DUF896 domain-containing protein [Aneurinibacillus migulanus]MED1616044.1 DUF896 domain-containing protein [Aneurinibacillus migulanus]SDJ97572.1 Uncharacterized protein YnzC, UPF0291/DUF896 family [Aneurinibacillus migulanus]